VIRLIATDLDGTLLRADKTVSERTRRSLAAARDAGLTVVLVSARPPRTVSRFAEAAGVSGYAVCCNGAIVYDLDEARVVLHTPFPSGVAVELVTRLRVALPGVNFAMEQELDFYCEPAYAALHPERANEFPQLVDALVRLSDPNASPVTKLIVRHPDHDLANLLELVTSLAGDRASVTHSGAPFVEVAAAGVHKAVGLAALCADLGIAAAEVAAFGDMPNDLPMLAWAGHAVAVANAHRDVLDTADEITASNLEDGVALVVERLTTAAQAVSGTTTRIAPG
jgi:Cof subfamily protein (haloacid dehalogenase superfamily)